MSTSCSTTSCDTTESAVGSCGGGQCPCGTSGCDGTPMNCALGMWSGSFFRAMKEVQVDLLKAKIQKAWGSKMDKVADAVLEAMGTHWQSMLAQAQAKEQLRARVAQIWEEGRK